MPVDFSRVPPNRPVPDTSELSRSGWALLLILIMGVGGGASIYTWPNGAPLSAWFWIQTVGLPVFCWAIALFVRIAWSGAERSMAIATNTVSEKAMNACHAKASKPLRLVSHSWCYSGDTNENEITRIVNGSLRLDPRKTGSWAAKSIAARWINIPNSDFAASNALGERARHRVITEWLFLVLLREMEGQLRTLPGSMLTKVTLSLDADVTKQEATGSLTAAIRNLNLPNLSDVSVVNNPLSIFFIDQLLDEATENIAHLIISVQLRGVISNRVLPGEAEAGVALLLCTDSAVTSEAPGIQIHRPSTSSITTVKEAFVNSMRWGSVAPDEPMSLWTHSLSLPVLSQLAPLINRIPKEKLYTVDATVGDCGVANSWLTLALAATQSREVGEPQIVAITESDQFFALACKT